MPQGSLPGWWLGDSDERAEEPYVSPARWDQELHKAGFGGLNTCCLDQDPPYQINANIVAKHAETSASLKRVTLLTGSEVSQNAYQVKDLFISAGFEVDFCSLTQEPPPNQSIISLLDLDAPFFREISEEDLHTFLNFTMKLGSSAMLWVTRACQMGCANPDYALVTGIARTIRSELCSSFIVFELDHTGPSAWSAVLKLFLQVQRRTIHDDLVHDSEYALSNGLIHISRFSWFSMSNELTNFSDEGPSKRLEIRKRGLLQTLQWVPALLRHLEPDEVEVEVRAAGLNFKVRYPTLLLP